VFTVRPSWVATAGQDVNLKFVPVNGALAPSWVTSSPCGALGPSDPVTVEHAERRGVLVREDQIAAAAGSRTVERETLEITG
jgi:hypothetical protein